MRRIIATLIVTLSVFSLAIGGFEAGYKQLNNYLVENVANDDVASNMKAAIEWLQEQQNVKQP